MAQKSSFIEHWLVGINFFICKITLFVLITTIVLNKEIEKDHQKCKYLVMYQRKTI